MAVAERELETLKTGLWYRHCSAPRTHVLELKDVRVSGSFVDVLDRVLDKGIVIDAWLQVSAVGIDLITVEARIVVASIETYLNYAASVAHAVPASRPVFEPS